MLRNKKINYKINSLILSTENSFGEPINRKFQIKSIDLCLCVTSNNYIPFIKWKLKILTVKRFYSRFDILFQFSACTNRNLLRCGASFRSGFFHLPYNICSRDHMTKNNMLSIQPISSVNRIWEEKLQKHLQTFDFAQNWFINVSLLLVNKTIYLLCGCNEKLWSICIWARVSHW